VYILEACVQMGGINGVRAETEDGDARGHSGLVERFVKLALWGVGVQWFYELLGTGGSTYGFCTCSSVVF